MSCSEGWVEVRGTVVHCHLLYDRDGVVLVDGGFLGAVRRIGRALERIDRGWQDVRVILLTHGHLDHTLNLAALKQRSGAPIFAPAADRAHVAGTHPYRGISRFCGWAEAFGRAVLRYRVPEVDRWLEPGEKIDLWGGLEAVALPGHTVGHTGFYSPSRRLLFCGDLFVNFLWVPRRSPPWFTDDRAAARRSLERAAELDLAGVLPAHSRRAAPARHLRDLHRLGGRPV